MRILRLIFRSRVMPLSFVVLSLVFLHGCASSTRPATQRPLPEPWMQSVAEYKYTLSPVHPDSLSSVFRVSNQMRDDVVARFGGVARHNAVAKLARWLIDTGGHNMRYDINANLSPVEAYQQRRGNCLSFTILLQSLAAELDINIAYNEVDLPDIWNMNDDGDLTLYRHVNAIYRDLGQYQIFDLAMEEYNTGYPQRIISKEAAAAKLFSNRAIRNLQMTDFESALHNMKLAISHAPDNAEMWVNLGVIYKRQQNLIRAEQAFLQAFKIDQYSGVAASNLERLYRLQQRSSEAARFGKVAKKMRSMNPYVYFEKAKSAYANNDLKVASKAIRRAQKLHDEDPRFFELSSRIKQRQLRYRSALKDLLKAHSLALHVKDQTRYANKSRMVAKLVQAQRSDKFGQRNAIEGLRRSVEVNGL